MDFRSVAAHEVGHGTGFAATYDWYYDDWGNALGTAASPYAWAGYRGLSRWDQNLRDAAGNSPLSGGTGTPGNFDECSDPAYFTGANAVACYGGNVPVYAPDPYEDGSSLSHLDDAALPGALMIHATGEGQMKRAPTRLECEILKDLGWSVLTTKTWTKGVSTLHWGDAGNWDPNGLPDESWDVAFTNTGLTSGNVIALDADRTINSLYLNTTVTFTLGETGHTLTLARGDLTRSAGSGGTQILRGIVDAGDGGVWNVGGPGELVVSGIATDPGALLDVKGGAYLTFEGIQDWGPDSTLLVREGVVSLNTDAGSAAEANLSIEIAGGTVNFSASQHLDSLTIGAGGKAVLKPGGAKVLVLNSLWIGTGSGLGSGPLETVPEPVTLALVALGAALAVWRRKR